MNNQKLLSPKTLYDQKTASGELAPDPEQAQVIERLDELHYNLSSSPRRKPGSIVTMDSGFRRNDAWWKKLFGKEDENIKGLYIYGGVGRGKSMLMDLFYQCLPEGFPKRRVHFHAFMIEVHDWLHRHRGKKVDTLLPDLAKEISGKTKLLCFDEFHVTDVADAMILGRLFTALFERGVIIVATSNFAPDDLYKGGLQRDRFAPFIALLKQHTDVMHLQGRHDYRAQCLAEEGVYFTPLGDMSRQKADGVFAHLTDHAEPYREELEVKGRKIPVPAVAKGAARFTFAELCERPRGAEDYIAIAKAYHTVFIDGAPVMNYDRRNEAKRFMTLIDALYESGTKVVITADAEPDKLYRSGDHAFEFQRTASRLYEMRGAAYLSR